MESRMPKFQMVSGPVDSRRFGRAININFGLAGESCRWHCIYCEWRQAKTKKMPQPATLIPDPESILTRIRSLLTKESRPVNSVILGGNSEPTLYPDLFILVNGLLKLRKDLEADWNLVCLTNAAGLDDPGMKKACALVDDVWVKLDCADEALYNRTNRPEPQNSNDYKAHLLAIRTIPKLGIQTTLWKFEGKPGAQNWVAGNLRELLDLYRVLQPKMIHLTTLKRKPASAELKPVSHEELDAFALRVAELGIPVEVFS